MSWSACFALILFIARFLVPAESAEEGETLWIACGWLALFAGVCWFAWREGVARFQVDRLDAAVALLVFGHVIAAILLLLGEGQKRHALNMLWEWLAVGAGFVMLRRIVLHGGLLGERHDTESLRCGRQALLVVLISIGGLLAGLGIWQRFVLYPQIAAQYRRWEVLQQSPRSQTSDKERRELQQSLGPELLALEGPAKAGLRQRILFSTEPFGRFALANTFAGVLMCVLLIVGGGLLQGWRGSSAFLRIAWLIVAGLLLLCLILTKSRTAMLGGLVGGSWLVVQWLREVGWSLKRMLLGIGGLIGMAIVALGLGMMSGLLDREVFTEGLKSTSYRLQYWNGAAEVIGEHPLFGVGPGSFRPHYLKHKLPEASEEISDPHNLFLDVWANGGVLPVLGLLWLGWMVVRSAAWPVGTARESTTTKRLSVSVSGIIVAGLLAGGLSYVFAYIVQARDDRQLLVLCCLWPIVVLIVAKLFALFELPAGLVSGVVVGLVLHLCGAGGIAMPVITLLLLVLIAFSTDEMQHPPVAIGVLPLLPLALAGGVGLVLVLVTGLGPVVQAGVLRGAGDYALYIEHRTDLAIRRYEEAATADGLDPRPQQQLAMAHIMLAQSGGRNGAAHLQSAIKAIDAAIDRDPHNPHSMHLAGEMHLKSFEKKGERESLNTAIDLLEQAVAGYPNSANIRGSLAIAQSQAEDIDAAKESAGRALELNEIQREQGHVDKLLEDAKVERLRDILEPRG